MNDSLDFGTSLRRDLSPKEKVKYDILGNRLGLSGENAKVLIDDIHKETASIFSLPKNAVNSDIDFLGREFDIVFTISKENIPDNKI